MSSSVSGSSSGVQQPSCPNQLETLRCPSSSNNSTLPICRTADPGASSTAWSLMASAAVSVPVCSLLNSLVLATLFRCRRLYTVDNALVALVCVNNILSEGVSLLMLRTLYGAVGYSLASYVHQFWYAFTYLVNPLIVLSMSVFRYLVLVRHHIYSFSCRNFALFALPPYFCTALLALPYTVLADQITSLQVLAVTTRGWPVHLVGRTPDASVIFHALFSTEIIGSSIALVFLYTSIGLSWVQSRVRITTQLLPRKTVQPPSVCKLRHYSFPFYRRANSIAPRQDDVAPGELRTGSRLQRSATANHPRNRFEVPDLSGHSNRFKITPTPVTSVPASPTRTVTPAPRRVSKPNHKPYPVVLVTPPSPTTPVSTPPLLYTPIANHLSPHTPTTRSRLPHTPMAASPQKRTFSAAQPAAAIDSHEPASERAHGAVIRAVAVAVTTTLLFTATLVVSMLPTVVWSHLLRSADCVVLPSQLFSALLFQLFLLCLVKCSSPLVFVIFNGVFRKRLRETIRIMCGNS